jgi:membrane protease YdiL (CAAX protease family)
MPVEGSQEFAMGAKTRVIGGASGALGLGTLAAAIGACCGLPWAVALLGVSGAVALARLSFLRPYALLGAGALLAVAFWWAYRPLPVCTDGTCNPVNRRPLRWIAWVAAVLVVGLAMVAFSSE